MPRRSGTLAGTFSPEQLRRVSPLLRRCYQALKQFLSNESVTNVIIFLCYGITAPIFLLGFVTFSGIWNLGDAIDCINQNDRSKTDEETEDLCLKFGYSGEEYKPNYAGPYAYIHWLSLGCCIILVTPRLAAIVFTDTRLDKLLKKIKSDIPENERRIACKAYVSETMGISHHLLYKRLFLHIHALTAYTIVFFLIDSIYYNLYLNSELFTLVSRDFKAFQDIISKTFPQFITCIMDGRFHKYPTSTELIRCELYYNYWIEKCVIALFGILATFFIITLISMFLEMSFMTSKGKRIWLTGYNECFSCLNKETLLPIYLMQKYIGNATSITIVDEIGKMQFQRGTLFPIYSS